MRVSIELTDEDYERLTAWAKAEHRSRTGQAAKIILDALDRRDQPLTQWPAGINPFGVQPKQVPPYTINISNSSGDPLGTPDA